MIDKLLAEGVPSNLIMFNLEGIDGSGKTVQSKRIVEVLNNLKIKAVAVASPSDSPIGLFLRKNLRKIDPKERSLLFVMDMISVLKKHNDYDGVIIWDRYKESNIVSNKDLSMKDAALWVDFLPDTIRVFFLDISPEIIMKKRPEALHDHSLDIDWQNLKYSRYKELARNNSDKIIVINADQDKEIITSEIVEKIIGYLKIESGE